MDYAACNVVYVDRSAREGLVKRDNATSTPLWIEPEDQVDGAAPSKVPEAVDGNLRTLLGTFSEGWYPVQLCP